MRYALIFVGAIFVAASFLAYATDAMSPEDRHNFTNGALFVGLLMLFCAYLIATRRDD